MSTKYTKLHQTLSILQTKNNMQIFRFSQWCNWDLSKIWCNIPVLQQFLDHLSKTLWHLKKTIWVNHPALQLKVHYLHSDKGIKHGVSPAQMPCLYSEATSMFYTTCTFK